MANRDTDLVKTPKDNIHLLTAKFVGNGTGEATLPEATQYGGGEIESMARTGTGTHTIVWRHKYPALKSVSISVVGATAGLTGRFTAIDMAAGTATIQLEVGATGTDAATTDTVFINLTCRNSGRNA
jgi:hypothetical protein